MEVYKLAKNDKSLTGKYVIITYLTLPDYTDMANFTQGPLTWKHQVMNDFYYPYRINAGKIHQITSLDETQTFTDAYIESAKHGKIVFEVGKFFRMKNYNYEIEAFDSDNYSISVYKYKVAVLTQSQYVTPRYTGVFHCFMFNGKIDKKLYYKNGIVVTKHCYYNNEFNTLQHVYSYTDTGVLISVYHYDHKENLTSQQTYRADGKTIHNTINYTTKADEPPLPAPVPPAKRAGITAGSLKRKSEE